MRLVIAIVAVSLVALAAVGWYAAGERAPEDAIVVAATDDAGLRGERLFTDNCAGCHGARAAGSDRGPPLVHKIYEPSHHGDAAFLLAALNGARAHHWNFGDMPPVAGVTKAEIAEITGHVRALQRKAGIR